MELRTAMMALCLAAISGQWLAAQNLVSDYLKNQPHAYSPDDPWKVGMVFRNHMGHGGLFYNCDHQEDKRYSPFIYWQTRQTACLPQRTIVGDVIEQLAEVRQRVCWGRCGAGPIAHNAVVGPNAANKKSLAQPVTGQTSKGPGVRAATNLDDSFRMTVVSGEEQTHSR